VTLQYWQAPDGARFVMTVVEAPDLSIDQLAWWIPGSGARKVRDTTALYLAREETYLTWVERPGTVVSLQATGLSEQELVAIAEGLRPIGGAGWRELIARAPARPAEGVTEQAVTGPDIGPPPGVSGSALENGYS